MPLAVTAQRNGGMLITSTPMPAAHKLSNTPQPTATASTKRIARLNPKLAASAADKVVLGPGVKLMAVHSISNAVNSALLMGWM
jgi:hypothetical protein